MSSFLRKSCFSLLSCGLAAAVGQIVVPQPAAHAATAKSVKANQVQKAIFVRLKAKPGKEAELAAFLNGAKPLVADEPQTALWFAVKFDASTFAIFDAFATEAGRDAHLAGKVAAALMANAATLLAEPPVIEKGDIMAKKVN